MSLCNSLLALFWEVMMVNEAVNQLSEEFVLDIWKFADPPIPWLLATGAPEQKTQVLAVQLDLQKTILEAKLKALGQIQALAAKG